MVNNYKDFRTKSRFFFGFRHFHRKLVPFFLIDFLVYHAYNKSRDFPTFDLRKADKIMAANMFIENAKVMAKGQITIPKDIRDVLGVSNGDRVTFIVEGNTVRMVNSTVYAMQMLQQEMAEEAARTGLASEDDVMALVKELKQEDTPA